MALATWVGLGTLTGGTGIVSPSLPAGLATDDLLLLFVETADQAVTAPSGWTQVPGSPASNAGTNISLATRLSVFYRRYVGGLTAPAIADPGDHAIAIIGAIRGVFATGSPFNVGIGATGTTAFSFPGGTTSENDCLFVQAVAWQVESTAAQMSGAANAALANVTERHDAGLTSGNGGGLGIVTGEKATPGVVGATTATGSNQNKAYVTLALLPAVSPTFHDLAATFAGVGVMSPGLQRVIELGATFAGAGGLSAALGDTMYDLGVTFAGLGGMSATVAGGDVWTLAALMAGSGSMSADLQVAPVGGSGSVVAPFFSPGTVVDAVPFSSANEWPWAHEVVNFDTGAATAVRPRQVPFASVVVDMQGAAAFDLPAGEYWLIGEREGVIRRVRRTV